jgi:hypothetical protein
MRPSRGMGAISASKMPTGVKKARRDDTDFTQYAEGGRLVCMPTSTPRENVSPKALVRRCVKLAARVLLQRKHSLTLLKPRRNKR